MVSPTSWPNDTSRVWPSGSRRKATYPMGGPASLGPLRSRPSPRANAHNRSTSSRLETVAELPGLVWLLKGICRRVLASTCEHGGHSYVRSGGVSTRSHRRDDRDCRLTTARDRPFQSHLHAPSVSALWAPGLSRQAVPADIARLWESRPVVSAGSRRHLFAALLYEVS